MPATHRSMLLRFFRDAEALVTDRSIPEAVRKEIADVRAIFRQTWADIEAQAQADAEGKDTNETAAPVRLRSYTVLIREVIRKQGSQYVLYSHTGKVIGKFPSKKKAMERERQVKFFKYQGEVLAGGTMDEEKKKLAEQDELPLPPEGEAPPPEAGGEEETIAKEFITQFEGKGKRKYDYWLLAVSTDPANGLAVIVQSGEMGTVYAVPYIKTTDGYAFSQEDDWQEAEASYAFGQKVQVGNEAPAMPAEPTAPTPNEAPAMPGEQPTMAKAEPTSDNIAEVASNVAIAEDAAGGPVVMHVELIQPGPGNAKDAHYYPKEVLARDAHVFNRAHMYESDHGNDKTTRTWVSTVTGIIGTSEKGAPIAEVLVHDPDFAQRVRNLAAGKLLNELQCSIMATGAIRKGEMDGKQYNIVEQLVSGGDVDWVTKAGAGGHAVAIAESVKSLSTPEIDEWLQSQSLHEAVKARLRSGKYTSVAELEKASQVEIHYLKEVTGSGQVIGMAEAAAPKPVLTAEDRAARFAEIDRRYGIRR